MGNDSIICNYLSCAIPPLYFVAPGCKLDSKVNKQTFSEPLFSGQLEYNEFVEQLNFLCRFRARQIFNGKTFAQLAKPFFSLWRINRICDRRLATAFQSFHKVVCPRWQHLSSSVSSMASIFPVLNSTSSIAFALSAILFLAFGVVLDSNVCSTIAVHVDPWQPMFIDSTSGPALPFILYCILHLLGCVSRISRANDTEYGLPPCTSRH